MVKYFKMQRKYMKDAVFTNTNTTFRYNIYNKIIFFKAKILIFKVGSASTSVTDISFRKFGPVRIVLSISNFV